MQGLRGWASRLCTPRPPGPLPGWKLLCRPLQERARAKGREVSRMENTGNLLKWVPACCPRRGRGASTSRSAPVFPQRKTLQALPGASE